MAGTSLLALIDDIAGILDDVALMSKTAAQKTAGVLGDDLALNAQQVAGVRAERELPVVWAVAKGSLKNKAILAPAALAISAFAPWGVTPLLMAGGAYLCFEGFEKLAHGLLHGGEEERHANVSGMDPAALEKEKIQGAIRTDFILSAEIIVIALGTVAEAPFVQQLIVVAGVAVLMTIGVYGIVAAIVKMDDAGLYLSRRGSVLRVIGGLLVAAAPRLMKLLSVAGTVAMFMVGGGILMHGLHGARDIIHHAAEAADGIPLLPAIVPAALNALAGVIAGALALAIVSLAAKLWRKLKPAA